MQLALNAAFGLVIGLGLWLIGVPSAPLWGLLAMILRFVPYVGALDRRDFSSASRRSRRFRMDDGPLDGPTLYIVVEPLVGHVVEPMLFGHSAGLSPVAVVVAATFWTWLWGPIGLILATPLTICLVVLGRHVDRLKFLEVMLGDQPALTPPELIYQRMLAGDPVEASEQARLFLREKPLIAYYDEILLEGIKLAQVDAERNRLDEDSMRRIRDAVAEIVDDLDTEKEDTEFEKDDKEHKEDAKAAEQSPLAQLEKLEAAPEAKPLPVQWRTGKPVLCVPGAGLRARCSA